MKNELENKKEIQKAKTIPALILNRIYKDIEQVQKKYNCLNIYNSDLNDLIWIEAIAVSKKTIEKYNLSTADLIQTHFSKRIIIKIDEHYLEKGATIYGLDKWADLDRIYPSKQHFYNNQKIDDMYELCVCPTTSIKNMINPLLDNIRTAEHIMNAYELFLVGCTDKIILKDYSHGEKGIKEYEQERKQK